MKFFSCQPDSHNAFVSLTNCTLTYFTIDCPRYQTYSIPAPAAAEASANGGGGGGRGLADNTGVAAGRGGGGTGKGDGLSVHWRQGGHPRSPGGAVPSAQQETKAHVQSIVILPDCFHAQSSCFSMANRSLFGTELAFVGTSNGLLALVVVADKGVVFAPGKDPDTLRDVEKRQRYHHFTRAGGSGGYVSSATSAAGSSRGAGGGHSHPREDAGRHRGSIGRVGGDAAGTSAGNEDALRDGSTGGAAAGGLSSVSSYGNSGAEDSAAEDNPSVSRSGGGGGGDRDEDGASEPSLNSSLPSVSGYHSGGSSGGSTAGASGGGGAGGTGGAASPSQRRRAAARLETPSTITWMRDKPLILVGYTTGRVQWYQVSVSPAKQQQFADPNLEEPYRAAIPAGALIHHINDPANSTNARVTSVASGGRGDGVTVELLTGCVLPDSGALVTSDYFPANGYVVVGGERSIALFSANQPEAPICRMANFGCSFLYCHPFLPLVGTLSWGWSTIGPCYYYRRHHDRHHQGHHDGAKAGGPGVFVGNPNGYGGGCLFNMLELEENGGQGRGGGGGVLEDTDADTSVSGLDGWEGSGNNPAATGKGDIGGDGGEGGGGDAAGGARSGGEKQGGGHGRRQRRGSGHGPPRVRAPFRFRHVQQRLMESHSPRYGAYFSFSWKFSFDLELGVCNVEEGLVSVIRFRRRTAPNVPPETEASATSAALAAGASAPARGNAADSFPYLLIHEHRFRLPLHSLVNVEYVSAATSGLTVPAAGSGASGKTKEATMPAERAEEARRVYYARAAAACEAGGGGSGRGRAMGSAGAAGARHGDGLYPMPARTAHAAVAAPHRFAALFQAQETLAHSAMLMTLSVDTTPDGDVAPGGGGGGGGSALRLRESHHSSSSALLSSHRGARLDRYANSLGAAALAASAGGNDFAASAPVTLEGGADGVGDVREGRGRRGGSMPAGAGVGSGGGAVSLKENILAAELLQPVVMGPIGTGRKRRSGGGGGGRRDAKGRRRSWQSATGSSAGSQALTAGGGSTRGSSNANNNTVGNAFGSFGSFGEEAHDLRSLLQVGPGSTSSIVGMNFAGEVASVPVEMEAIATWHEEGSVFVGLGATICAADIVTIQGIERQMKRRMESGFRLSAEGNVRALATVSRKSVRNTYSGLNNEGSTTAMSDLSTIFTYVASLMGIGLIGAVGDVPSVCELLALQERGSEDATRAEAILSTANAKLPQALRNLQRQRQEQSGGGGGGGGDGGGGGGGSGSATAATVTSGDALREATRSFLLHILNWLPPSIDLATGRVLAGSGDEASPLSESRSTDQDIERAVAVQVLHGCFAAGAAILRRFGYRHASYPTMANLIASHDDTLSAIRESDAHVRETFLSSLSPWLLAVFLYLCADSEDTQNYRARIYGNAYLPLWDRVAIALILETDTVRLLRVVHGTLLRDCTLLQALMLVHGISTATYPMMQEIVDGTGDFQLAACLYARIGVMSPQFLHLFPKASARAPCSSPSPPEPAASHSAGCNRSTRHGGGGSGGGASDGEGNGLPKRRRSASSGSSNAAIPRASATAEAGTCRGGDGGGPATSLLHFVAPSASSPFDFSSSVLHEEGEPQKSGGGPPPATRLSRSSSALARSAHGTTATGTAGLLDPTRLASSRLPPPPPPPMPLLAAASVTRLPQHQQHQQQRLPTSELPLVLAGGVPSTSSGHPPLPAAGAAPPPPPPPPSMIAMWVDAGLASVLPPFFHKHQRDHVLGATDSPDGPSPARPTAATATASPTLSSSSYGPAGDGEEGAEQEEDCPWVWWVAAYRAFLDSEQAFVERTMFDVACQRLREEGDAILASAATLVEAAVTRAAPVGASIAGSGGGSGGGGGNSSLSMAASLSSPVGPLNTLIASRGSPSTGKGQFLIVPSSSHGGGGSPLVPQQQQQQLPQLQRPPLPASSLDSSVPLLESGSPTNEKVLLRQQQHQVYSPTLRSDGMPEATLVARADAASSPLDPASCPSSLITAEQYRMILGALSNRTPRCSVCLEPVKVHQRESTRSLAWCTACLHGGHADHMQQWFSQHRTCPVEGCLCHCDEDVSLY